MQISDGDRHRVLRDLARRQRGVPRQRLGRGLRERAAGADADDALVRLDQIAGARQQEHRFLVEHDQHRFEPAQRAIGAPVLGELDRRALEVAAILLELGFEPREQRERIGRRSGKAREDVVVVKAADLARALLDDGVAERDLPVAGQHRAIVPAHGQDGGRVEGRLHPCSVSHAPPEAGQANTARCAAWHKQRQEWVTMDVPRRVASAPEGARMTLRVVAIPLIAAICLGSPAMASTSTDDEQQVKGRGARDRSGSSGGTRTAVAAAAVQQPRRWQRREPRRQSHRPTAHRRASR